MNGRLAIQIYMIYLFSFVFTGSANAYFDPGSGSLLLQVLIALFGGLVVFYHKILFEIKKLPSKLKKTLTRVLPNCREK